MGGAELECGMSSESAVQGRIARKTYWCMNDFAHDRHIHPGDAYLVWTDFPGSDAGYATTAGHPVQFRQCADCAVSSGHEAKLPGAA